jgi:beta-lactamase class A
VPTAAAAEQSLRSRIVELARELPGEYTVAVREIDGARREIDVNSRADREPASVIKVFIAYGALKRIDAGTLAYSSKVSSGLTVRECLRAMLEVSDNYCAAELRYRVGTSNLNRLLHRDGYRDTHFWYSGGRTKVTSSRDLAVLLSRLESGTLLSPESTTRMLALMRSNIWRDGIATGLPRSVDHASKSGLLWIGSGIVRTDAAIVYGPTSRYVLAIMGTRGATLAGLGRISRLVYERLQGEEVRHPFHYSQQQMRTTERAALRSSPGGGVLRSVGRGTPVHFTSAVHRWYRVTVNGRTGWMHNSALTLRNP